MLARVPIRIRLTLTFAVAMAVLLSALGGFLWLELRDRLDESIDDTLRSRLGEVAGLAAATAGGNAATSGASDEDETFAQVVRANGTLAYSSALLGDEPLISPAVVDGRDESDPVLVDGVRIPEVEGQLRLIGAQLGGGGYVVVGASLDDRDETLANLATLLAIGVPAALLIASIAGYAVAGRALAPVDAMRRRAAEI